MRSDRLTTDPSLLRLWLCTTDGRRGGAAVAPAARTVGGGELEGRGEGEVEGVDGGMGGMSKSVFDKLEERRGRGSRGGWMAWERGKGY